MFGTKLLMLIAAVLGTVGASLASASGAVLENPIPEPIEEGFVIDLEPVAMGLTAPNWGTAAPGVPDRLFVTDQDGIVWSIDLSTGSKSVLLDVSDRLVSLGIGGEGTFDERGLLGLAFHPSYETNGLLYTYTSEPVAGPADFSTMPSGVTANHQSVITEWQVPAPTSPASVVDPDSDRELLRVDQPQFNHDAGALNFGPDDMLFISLGDGGAADDQGVGHSPQGNGQDPGNVLGTILRIDPLGEDSANGQYGIPADNPFVDISGIADEIFAFGFRNPFRFSFDSATGDLYAADVGQNDVEEVDVVVAGGNYGWRIKEGSFCFDPNGDDPGFVTDDPDPTCSSGIDLIDPIAEYDHDEGIAIIGGFVYRGRRIPQLRGRYVFGDFFLPSIFSGRLFVLNKKNVVRRKKTKQSKVLELIQEGDGPPGMVVLGFGQDADRELYVLGNMTGVPFGETGVVRKLVPSRFD